MVQPERVWDPAVSATRDPAIFFVYGAVATLLFFASWWVGRGHKDVSGVVLVPFIAAALAFDSYTLAIDALNGVLVSAYPRDRLFNPVSGALIVPDAAETSEGVVIVGLQRLRAAVLAFVVPALLVCEFELNYEVHKRRSANFFCGLIAFDQGHRTTTGFCGAIVRYGVWVVALLLLLVAVVVNAPQMTDPALAMPPYTRFTAYGAACVTSRAPGAGFGWGDAADFIPMLLLVAFSTYTGASLWRYGTTISTDVRATSLNPWASVTAATVGLTLAWALSPLGWPLPYATQAMLLALTAALVVTQACVESNLRTLEEWAAIVAAANDEILAATARRQEAEAILAQHKSLGGGGASAATTGAGRSRSRHGGGRSASGSTARRVVLLSRPPSGGDGGAGGGRSSSVEDDGGGGTDVEAGAGALPAGGGTGVARQRSWREALSSSFSLSSGTGRGRRAAGGGVLSSAPPPQEARQVRSEAAAFGVELTATGMGQPQPQQQRQPQPRQLQPAARARAPASAANAAAAQPAPLQPVTAAAIASRPLMAALGLPPAGEHAAAAAQRRRQQQQPAAVTTTAVAPAPAPLPAVSVTAASIATYSVSLGPGLDDGGSSSSGGLSAAVDEEALTSPAAPMAAPPAAQSTPAAARRRPTPPATRVAAATATAAATPAPAVAAPAETETSPIVYHSRPPLAAAAATPAGGGGGGVPHARVGALTSRRSRGSEGAAGLAPQTPAAAVAAAPAAAAPAAGDAEGAPGSEEAKAAARYYEPQRAVRSLTGYRSPAAAILMGSKAASKGGGGGGSRR